MRTAAIQGNCKVHDFTAERPVRHTTVGPLKSLGSSRTPAPRRATGGAARYCDRMPSVARRVSVDRSRRLLLHLADRRAHFALVGALGEVLQADHADRLAVAVADEDALDLAARHQ